MDMFEKYVESYTMPGDMSCSIVAKCQLRQINYSSYVYLWKIVLKFWKLMIFSYAIFKLQFSQHFIYSHTAEIWNKLAPDYFYQFGEKLG